MKIAWGNPRPSIEARSLENPTISSGASLEEWLGFWGQISGGTQLPHVTVDRALEVPAIWAAVMFLSRTLAALPLHAFRKVKGEDQRTDGDLQMLLNEAPNGEWSSYSFRQYLWQQVFTVGRGLAWIERTGPKIHAIWPLDTNSTFVSRINGRKVYRCHGQEYPAADIIDIPFALKSNQVDVYAPLRNGRKAIALMIAMNDFAGGFFAGGGVPPLALEGPLPQGAEGFKRAQADIQRAIDMAKKSGSPFFGMPPGHALKAIGVDPDKGQMTEARRFGIEEAGRLYQLPPVFIGDLTKGTFANTEQQDINLVKHCITHWAKAGEDEINLKLFGQRRRTRSARHNLDAIQRGDFKTRIEALARGVQTSLYTPDEARALEGRPAKPGGDRLFIQGATVPLEAAGTQPAPTAPPPTDKEEGDDDDATRDARDDDEA